MNTCAWQSTVAAYAAAVHHVDAACDGRVSAAAAAAAPTITVAAAAAIIQQVALQLSHGIQQVRLPCWQHCSTAVIICTCVG